ncbi:MAG: hypothetical protein HYY06_08780 [Deltaproteobacteria bacterium]|nr:hypothetical protein [Deltaproteobacteria bacterium]
MSIQVDPGSMTIRVTSQRETPQGPSRRFAEALRQGAQVLASGVSGAAGALPGAPILSAAVRGAASAGSVNDASSAEAPGANAAPGTEQGQSDIERLMQESQSFNMYYLEIQEGMSRENRRYSAMSNVMKARHETAKSAIGNIR